MYKRASKSASCYLQRRQARSNSSSVGPRRRKKNNRDKALKRIRAAKKRGEVLVGSVKNVQPYGAFIQLGSIDGLVHISELADHPVRNVQDILHPGMSVQVIVLHVDEQAKRIALSMRQVPRSVSRFVI